MDAMGYVTILNKYSQNQSKTMKNNSYPTREIEKITQHFSSKLIEFFSVMKEESKYANTFIYNVGEFPKND